MFKDTSSHGLFSLQFLCAFGMFFGLPISYQKIQLQNYTGIFSIKH